MNIYIDESLLLSFCLALVVFGVIGLVAAYFVNRRANRKIEEKAKSMLEPTKVNGKFKL